MVQLNSIQFHSACLQIYFTWILKTKANAKKQNWKKRRYIWNSSCDSHSTHLRSPSKRFQSTLFCLSLFICLCDKSRSYGRASTTNAFQLRNVIIYFFFFVQKINGRNSNTNEKLSLLFVYRSHNFAYKLKQLNATMSRMKQKHTCTTLGDSVQFCLQEFTQFYKWQEKIVSLKYTRTRIHVHKARVEIHKCLFSLSLSFVAVKFPYSQWCDDFGSLLYYTKRTFAL